MILQAGRVMPGIYCVKEGCPLFFFLIFFAFLSFSHWTRFSFLRIKIQTEQVFHLLELWTQNLLLSLMKMSAMILKVLLLRRTPHQKLRELASARQAWKAQLPMTAQLSNLTSVVRDSFCMAFINLYKNIPVLQVVLS